MDANVRSPRAGSALPWEGTPAWWKVAAAFTVGAILMGLSLVRMVPPESSEEGARSFQALTGLGSEEAAFDPETGQLIDPTTGEALVDPETGEALFVDQSGRVVRRPTGSRGGAGSGTTSGSGGGGSGTAGEGGRAGSEGRAGREGGRSGGGAAVGGGGGGGASGGTNPDGSPIECAPGKNGGVTDEGVTATDIRLGATVAESGVAQAFLGEVRQAMEAVKNKVNRSGGICGRRLQIVYKDDGWNADTGFRFIQNLVEQDKVFALPVVPSSEGLNQASLNGYLRNKGVPVVGSDGMIRTQYTDPVIWPVAAATVTQMHVMMKDAWDRGARNPAIVFENTYRFGVEGAYAFNQAFKRLSGQDIPGYKNPLQGGGATCGGQGKDARFCGIPANSQYGSQVSALNSACNVQDPCDFVALLLEPVTALKWMKTSGVKEPKHLPKGMGAAQPLFTRDFGVGCHDRCAGMWIWTGYNPPIEQYQNSGPVQQYMSDLRSQSSAADPYNQFTMGGYLGMKLLVDALQKTPHLTRPNLTRTLDQTTLQTGLSPALTWRAGNHFANPAAQAFEIQSKNGFTGWRFARGYINDPWLGQDVS